MLVQYTARSSDGRDETRTGKVVGVVGLHLRVRVQQAPNVDPKQRGLARQAIELVGAHQAIDEDQWRQAYQRFGEPLFDEDGDRII